MKKLIRTILIAVLIFSLINIHCFAKEEISVEINGEQVEFDVAPVVINGRTMVPIRAVCEKSGADVYWFDEEYQFVIIVKNDIKLFLGIGFNDIMELNVENFENMQNITDVDIKTHISDVAPVIKNGRTLLPIRKICELLGGNVEWQEEKRHIKITYPQEVIEEKNTDRLFFEQFVNFYHFFNTPSPLETNFETSFIFSNFDNEEECVAFKAILKNRIADLSELDYELKISSDVLTMILYHNSMADSEAVKQIINKKHSLKFTDCDGKMILDEKNVISADAKKIKTGDIVENCVEIIFTKEGAKLFSEATEKLSGSNIYIYVDDECISNPEINEKITGEAVIVQGNFTSEQAREFCNYINMAVSPFEYDLQIKTVGRYSGYTVLIPKDLYNNDTQNLLCDTFGEDIKFDVVAIEDFLPKTRLVLSTSAKYLIVGKFDGDFLKENIDLFEKTGVLSDGNSYIVN